MNTTLEKLANNEVAAANAANETRYTFTPRVDIYENDNAFVIEAELPGVADNGVDLKYEDGVLTLLGRVEAQDVAGYSRAYTEYEVGNYERAFRVPEEIDPDRIQAALKNGLLRLNLPKREAVRPRRIEVKVG